MWSKVNLLYFAVHISCLQFKQLVLRFAGLLHHEIRKKTSKVPDLHIVAFLWDILQSFKGSLLCHTAWTKPCKLIIFQYIKSHDLSYQSHNMCRPVQSTTDVNEIQMSDLSQSIFRTYISTKWTSIEEAQCSWHSVHIQLMAIPRSPLQPPKTDLWIFIHLRWF